MPQYGNFNSELVYSFSGEFYGVATGITKRCVLVSDSRMYRGLIKLRIFGVILRNLSTVGHRVLLNPYTAVGQ